MDTNITILPDEELWPQLLELIKAGQVIPVIGQELLQVPTAQGESSFYSVLAQRLAVALGDQKSLPERFALNAVATRYLAGHGEAKQISRALKGIVEEEAARLPDVPLPLRQLASITEFKLFVTTTFDSLLERAINQTRSDGAQKADVLFYRTDTEFGDIRSSISNLQRPTIYHLLGKLSPSPEYVVTEEDALEFVHALHKRRPENLFDELGKKSLLVIGCSFPSWLVRFFLRVSRPQRLRFPQDKSDFVVEPNIRADPLLIDFLRSFNTGVEIFQTLQPVEFVAELYERWKAMPRYPIDAQTEHQVESDAIFVSYAKEDRAAAARICENLKKINLPVWFDEEQLLSGDQFRQKIKTGIKRASFFIPVLSKFSVQQLTGYYRDEWLDADEVNRQRPESLKFFMPVRVDNSLTYEDADIPIFFRHLTWEEAPGGQVSPEFVTKLRDLFKHYQARKAGRS